MRFTIQTTSHQRHWSGIVASIYETSGGYTQSAPGANICFSMHLSAPIRALCGFDGKRTSRLQIAGDIDLLPPGTCAAWRDEGATTMLGVKIEPLLLNAAAAGMGFDPDRVTIVPRLQLRDPQIEHLLWALKAELECGEPLGRAYAESIGVALVTHLLRRYAKGDPAYRGAHSDRRMRRVVEYMHDNLSTDLSLFVLAELAGLSPTQFKAVFKRYTGQPVHQYIIRRRVEYAAALIAGGARPLSEIALEAGFSSQSHMARFMRRIIGASPTQIRPMH